MKKVQLRFADFFGRVNQPKTVSKWQRKDCDRAAVQFPIDNKTGKRNQAITWLHWRYLYLAYFHYLALSLAVYLL
jgi:hypothetical protein